LPEETGKRVATRNTKSDQDLSICGYLPPDGIESKETITPALRSQIMENQTKTQNLETYRRLREVIGASYAPGWFVGIADDQIVGAAEKFPELTATLKSRGFDPRQVMVVEAGVAYPEKVTIYI
jgi:hypothetical protein